MSNDASDGSPSLPRHIAIVMDGNGRWAQQRGQRRTAGHRAGVNSTRAIVEHCGKLGVEVLTLFAFSSENWKRPESEVGVLMTLFVEALGREVNDLHAKNVRLKFIGELDKLSDKLRKKIDAGESLTANNTGLRLFIAVSYGGRWDIAQAAKALAQQVEQGTLQASMLSEELLHKHLALADVVDPDLFIRTGGEQRISNFLLWNLAYSELYFSNTLWPDFDAAELDRAIDFFTGRERRFGRVLDAVNEAG